MTGRTYEHLGLKAWPFNRAGPETGSIWIGRPEVRRRVNLLLRSASRVPASQLVLLWADLGAGKTHALRHMEWLARDNPDLITILLTTPRGIGSFFDMYRAAIDGAAGALGSAGRDLFDRTIKGEVSSDIERAIIAIGTYRDDVARIAHAWLRGDAVQRQASKEVGVTSHIRTSAEAIDALSDLIRVLRRGNRTVLLLVDEVQELGDLASKKQAEAVGGLHKVFDKNPEGLTLVLSFTAAQQATMLNLISGPLADRANDTITLPSVDRAEAAELVNGLLANAARDGTAPPFPFEADAITAVIELMDRRLPELSPRSVILTFDAILREAEIDLEERTINVIDRAYALSHVPDRDGAQQRDT